MAKKRKSKSTKKYALIIALLAIIVVVALILILSPSDGNSNTIGEDIVGDNIKGTENATKKELLEIADLPDATTPVQETAESGNTKITLLGMTANIDGAGAKVDGKMVKITKGGIYEISGTLDDGRIVVKAKGEDVVIILNGVDVTCSDSAPLYIHKANSVTLILNGTTENVFTDGSSYDYTLDYCDELESKPNSCIYSKSDLIIRGTGTLVVNGNYMGGLRSNDNLTIINTNVVVNALNHGINGKDSLTITNSTVSVTAGGDALRSTKDNDVTLGYGVLTDSNIYITSGEDGIQTETGLIIDNCSLSITAAGGSEAALEPNAETAKGIKVNQGYAKIVGGNAVIDASDDCINAVGNINIENGKLTLNAGDDAIHSKAIITLNCDMLNIESSEDGIKGVAVNLTGGLCYVNSTDDGISASNYDDTADATVANSADYINITGGYTVVNAGADSLDSDGDITHSGGTLIAYGDLDYLGNYNLTGGTLISFGLAETAQTPNSLSQCCIDVAFDEALHLGDVVNISGSSLDVSLYVPGNADSLIYSAPELASTATYTVSYGGKYSGGELGDVIFTGGKYSGGKTLADVTFSGYLATNH